MNILILNWKDVKNPTSGGAEIVTHEHARRWVKKGNEVIWLTSSFKGAKKHETNEGIKIIRFGNIYSLYLYAPFFYLFSGNKFDLVIDEVHGIPLFTPLFVKKRKIVLIHEIAGEIWGHMYSFPLNMLGKILESFYLRIYRNQKFWTDAKSTVNELARHGIKKENCIAIPCPSNVTPLTEIPNKNKEVTFITVNRLVKMKGIEDVLTAFSYISKSIKNSNLLVLGSGKEGYAETLKKLVKELGISNKVQFLGFVDEKTKVDLLRKSHILLHASVKEGWGIVVIEAASQATPSVVYNVSGLNESVKNNITGIVVTKNTPDQMATEVMSLISDKKRYNNYQINGLKWARSLTWEKAASRSLSLLNNTKE